MKILLFRPPLAGASAEIRRIVPQAEIRQTQDPRELSVALPWAEVIFGNVSPDLLRTASRLQWLQIVSAGVEDYEPVLPAPFALTNAHGLHAETIAQHVVMSLLGFARGQWHFLRCQQARVWDRNPAVPFSPRGQRLGLIGFGSIARALLPFLPVLGLRACAVARKPAACPPELERYEPASTGLDALLAESDHLVLALPGGAETRMLIDARRVGLIKRGAFVYNVSRGSVMDQAALTTRLAEGSLGGAALDVFATEPLPPDDPLWTLSNVMVTPHLAGHERGLARAVFELFLDNLARYRRGAPLRNRVGLTDTCASTPAGSVP